jgi:ketosteroid isomerase-like protein
MPSRGAVEGLIALVEQGRFIEALESYYADDAATFENMGEARRGRETLIANERGVMAAFPTIHSRCVRPVFVDGDRAVIRWQFEFVPASGPARRMDELAYQLWNGDRIVEERFFYDPAQMRA